jgi:hypothetical protein
MNTQDKKSREVPKLVGIWRLGIIENALIDPQITREKITALANWRVIKKEKNYLVKKMPQI